MRAKWDGQSRDVGTDAFFEKLICCLKSLDNFSPNFF